MRGIRSLAVFAAATLIGVAYAQIQQQGKPAATSISDIVAYAAFHADASGLATMPVASAADVDTALDLAARHDRDALVRGWMSYAADVAAQSPAFAEGARATQARLGANIVTRITSNRAFARSLPGAEDAIGRVLGALAADASRIAAIAERHRGFAYSLQNQDWARAASDRRDERLQRVRSLGRPGGFTAAIPISVAAQLSARPNSAAGDDSAFGGRHFWDALYESPSRENPSADAAAWREDAARPQTLNAILSVAALRVLGVQEAEASAIAYLLRDPRGIACVDMARLQFHQCLSATRFLYEEEFCLAQHALRDTAMCMTSPIARDGAYAAAFAAPEAPADLVAVAAVADADEAAAQAADEPAPATQQAAVETVPGLLGAAETPPAVAEADAADEVAEAAHPGATANLAAMGAGELFAHADELDEQGETARARTARRSLIARFPDSPLALLAAQRLADAASSERRQ